MTDSKTLVQELSRELRAPLTVISGYLETLYDNNEEWQGPLDQMLKQSSKIDRLLSDLVFLTSLDTIDVQAAAVDTFDIEPLIRMVMEEQSICHPGKRFSCDLSADSSIRGNSEQLYTALTKLLENASENTSPDGRIDVSWQQSKDKRILSIVDDGVGIHDLHLSRVTERFYRIDLNSDGVGLGLCIAKQVLKCHSARLIIRSEFGEGTRVDCIFTAS